MNTASPTPTELVARLRGYVLLTRRWGQCYVHADVRRAVYGWQGLDATVDGSARIRLSYGPWGRSKTKYRAAAHYASSGRPVPTKILTTAKIQPLQP